jgi:hypothetical protein
MYTEPGASIIRFFTADGIVVGGGFLVAADTVLTCAHVVTAALRIFRNQDTPDASAASVCLDFPIVAPGHKLFAHVDAQSWHPPQPDESGDIAILHLDSDPPEGVKVVHLVHTDADLWGHRFRLFGFPDGHPGGTWASGVIRGPGANWIQIEDVKNPGYPVQRGFSGGAVWDDQLGGIVGMAVAADTDAAKKVGYMIPTDVLIKAWPQLRQQSIPPCPYRGLLAFREQDEPYFFGRDAFTRQLVDAINLRPLLAIIGVSGSGKSSVVFAGLIPYLHKLAGWLIISFRPLGHPFHSLSLALMPYLEPDKSETERLIEINKLADYLRQGKQLSLQQVMVRIAQKPPACASCWLPTSLRSSTHSAMSQRPASVS